MRVNTLETCADGFERLRYQSEFILCAYPGRDDTAESILAELLGDVDSCGRPDAFNFEAAEAAIRGWFDDGGAERLRAELAAIDWPADDESDVESESVCFRLYVEQTQAELDAEALPRLSVCVDCLQYVANGGAELDAETLAAVQAGVEREQAEGGRLVPDDGDGDGAFSWSPCECCRSPLGGNRHRLALLPK